MNTVLIEILICPQCLPDEQRLSCNIEQQNHEDIIKGVLTCPKCRVEYPIQDGIAFLLPVDFSNSFSLNFKYEDPRVLSSYLWSHFADLARDPEATGAYENWAGLIENKGGLAIDAGCAVGRLTFELTKKADFVIGVDASSSFLRKARELKVKKKIQFTIPSEGMLEETMTVTLPESFHTQKMEFVLADVQRLPFISSSFSTVVSLNIIDKLPSPLTHLVELNRLARGRDAQFLFSDPFSWSKDVAKPENWLGGKKAGEFSGPGMKNVKKILTGESGHLIPQWSIKNTGYVWWKIRNHQNHFELIRSQYLKAVR